MAVVQESTPPWVPEFRTVLANAGVHGLNANHLTILSDYSDKGKFRTLSFLIFDHGSSPEWPQLRRSLRGRMPDNRRFSYKALGGSSHLERFLDEFLAIADSLNGWLFTIAIDNDLHSLVADEDTRFAWERFAELTGRWKNQKQFENVLRINLFLALVLSPVIGNTPTLEWVSDQDDIFANDERSTDVTKMLRLSLGAFTPDIERQIVVGTSEIDTGHRGIEDLLSIPDLAAGAIGDAATHNYEIDCVSDKTVRIAKWLSACNNNLRKFTLEFRFRPSGRMCMHQLQTELATMGRQQ